MSPADVATRAGRRVGSTAPMHPDNRIPEESFDVR